MHRMKKESLTDLKIKRKTQKEQQKLCLFSFPMCFCGLFLLAARFPFKGESVYILLGFGIQFTGVSNQAKIFNLPLVPFTVL